MLEYCNWTQVPNKLLDEWFPKLKEAELRVFLIIIRYTLGYHRKEHPFSLSFLEKKTGMSRQGVINGIQDLLDKGVISRHCSTQCSKTFIYSLVFKETLDSQLSGLEVVNEVDHQVVNQVDTVKETEEKKKANNSIPLPPSKGEDTPNPLKGAAAAASSEKEVLKKELLKRMNEDEFEHGWKVYQVKLKLEKIENPAGLIFRAGRDRWPIPASVSSEEENFALMDKIRARCKDFIQKNQLVIGYNYIEFPWSNGCYRFEVHEKGFRESVLSQLRKMNVDVSGL